MKRDDMKYERDSAVADEMSALLRPYGSPTRLHWILRESLDQVISLAAEDLAALTMADPASRGSWKYVLDSYAAYRAVLSYRLGHAVQRAAGRVGDPARQSDLLVMARTISESAKIATGIEIHPAARVGRRFILDHGIGTVIGETTVIGDDCYLLQGVILGACGIAGNPSGKRHPTIGDRVEIGAYARLLGPITIGSDASVSPHTLVLTDVPANARVRLLNQCQIQTAPVRCTVLAVVPSGPRELRIHGSGLADSAVDFVRHDGTVADELPVTVTMTDPSNIVCRITGSQLPVREILRITGPNGDQTLLTQMEATWNTVSALSGELTCSAS